MPYSREELLGASGPALYNRAKELIPGGTQLLSKRPEMFAPDYWPAYFSKAKGCRVWDLDEREFIDMSIMGVGACVLGYADDEVDEAVTRVIRDGVSSTLNCPEEVELAEVLLDLHPWFDRVRYARSGGEAMAIAVRIARAATRRDVVLFSGYHGWSDWYLAANLAEDDALDGHLLPGLQPSGVPRGLLGTALPFPANDMAAFDELVRGRESSIAAIVIEPARGEEAPPGFLAHLREKASEIGAVLIFEITSGFRMCAGSMHRLFDIKPDVAVLAKSMANGYAMSAVMGRETVMDAAQETFVSSTNWTERVGPTAALATVRKYVREDVQDHITAVGQHFRESLRGAVPDGWVVDFSGISSLVAYRIRDPAGRPLEAELSVAMLEAGYLAYSQFKPSAAHATSTVDRFAAALAGAIGSLQFGSANRVPPRHRGFERLTAE